MQIRLAPSKTPKPVNLTYLHSFLGPVKQLVEITPDITGPFRNYKQSQEWAPTQLGSPLLEETGLSLHCLRAAFVWSVDHRSCYLPSPYMCLPP
ncbi:hypothetical protein SK128_021418 [Halocaridina rubra]|uniref:Uncharacterized protein n=1 Tax=Halocaridina rubra TaxID=373956 RepID=A0AAN8XN30_HALRR